MSSSSLQPIPTGITALEAAALRLLPGADRDPSPTLLRGEEIAAEFQRHLQNCAPLIEHLLKRGVSSEQIEQGHVGYCPPYFDHWFPLLRGRIIVPIRDASGRIVAFAGRIWEPMIPYVEKVFWDLYGHKPAEAQKRIDQWHRGKWLNEPYAKAKYLYHMDLAREKARERNFVVLVEGYLDALVLAANGIENVVALCGTRLTDRHAATISRYCDRVLVLLDGDAAGAAAISHIVPCLLQTDLQPFIVALPEGRDPDEVCLTIGGPKLYRAFQQRLAIAGEPDHIVRFNFPS